MCTNGLILSIDPRLQLKITSPGRLEDNHLLQIDIGSFHVEELQKRKNGDYYHWESHKKPQLVAHKQFTTSNVPRLELSIIIQMFESGFFDTALSNSCLFTVIYSNKKSSKFQHCID